MQTTRALVLLSCAVLAVHTLSAQTLQTRTPFSTSPARIVGQSSIKAMDSSYNPNWADARGLYAPAAVAVDTSVTPPALYVSDQGNNRVLGWRNAASFSNGAPADIVIGQRDTITTNPQGPNASGSSLSRGLYSPTGVAVDGQGNLYVVDGGNYRILRYPKPFDDPDNRINPDVVIGQADYNSGRANRGTTVAENGINPVPTADSNPATQQLTFDANGSLWFTDTGNHRVLRFSKSSDGQKIQGTADLVLGQANLTSNTALPLSQTGMLTLTGLRYPVGVTIDQAGRIYVADRLGRVLVYSANPLPAGTSALRLLGVLRQTSPPQPNATQFSLPMGLVMIGSNLGVVDPAWNRITIFDPFDSWPADAPNTSSPAAKTVVGQQNFTTNKLRAADASGLYAPLQAAFSGSELFVADTYNNRVVVFPQGVVSQPVGYGTALRVLGQRDFGYSAPNIIEGKELYLYGGTFADAGGLAIDTKSNPPRLYIADTYNNRIVGYKDARNVRPGDTADLVIGQTDLFSSGINGRSNDPTQMDANGLFWPAGLAVDAAGNLYVADCGNARVLRFPKPFDQADPRAQHANLVLGQRDFFSKNTDVSARNLAAPHGIAFMPEGHLLVSDVSDHRVLLFRKPEGGDFTSGMAASAVFGQPNFDTDAKTANVPNRMVNPRGIAVDSNGRLYVADTGNNRILVYSQVAGVNPGDDPSPVLTLTNSATTTALRTPMGVAVNPLSGEIWVAEFLGNSRGRILRYPEYSLALFNPLPDFMLNTGTSNTASPPLGVALDSFGNLLVAELANRISFYFPPLWTTNAANFLPSASAPVTYGQPCCAPGSIATLWPFSPASSFGAVETVKFDSLPNPVPLPKVLGDVQVLLSSADYQETTAPLYLVSPGQINLQMPKNVPVSGNLDVTVLRPSSGQILATGSIAMRSASPALFTNPAFPVGSPAPANAVMAVAQNNDDSPVSCNGIAGTPYDATYCPGGVRPAKRGEVITLYATGQGSLPGMPDDGAAASGQATTDKPDVIIETSIVSGANVQFSGLAPSLIGVWQINVKVPDTAAPGAMRIALRYRDLPSTVSGNPMTVIQVK